MLASGSLVNADRYARRRLLAPYATLPYGNAEDVWWDGDDLNDFTTVTVSGTQTITERDGVLSVKFADQSGGDYNGVFKARTFAIGDSFATKLSALRPNGQFSIHGLAFTDGVLSTSNVIQAIAYADVDTTLVGSSHGTLTNVATSAWADDNKHVPPWAEHGMIIRLTYSAANSFLSEFSIDGITWTSFENAAAAKTMTPTHVGLTWSTETGTTERAASYGPLCKVA